MSVEDIQLFGEELSRLIGTAIGRNVEETPAEYLEAQFDKVWKRDGYSQEYFSTLFEQYVTRFFTIAYYLRSPGSLMTIKEEHHNVFNCGICNGE